MRVSVMLHLPALARLGLLPKIIDEATSFGLSVRGLYGENTSGYGHIYQVSNRQTLGISDDEIINKIKAIVGTIISQERKARNVLKEKAAVLIDCGFFNCCPNRIEDHSGSVRCVIRERKVIQ